MKRPLSPRLQRVNGFTLMEVILAAAVFALVAAAAFTFLDSSRRLDERIHFKSEVYQTARAALSLMERDLRGAFGSGGKFGTGILGTDAGEQDEIEMVSVNHKPWSEEGEGLNEIDLSRTIYKIDPSRGLVRIKLTRLTEEGRVYNMDELAQDVSDKITKIDVQYDDGNGWIDNWNTESTQTMPKAIRISVTVEVEYHGKVEEDSLSKTFWLPIGQNYEERPQNETNPEEGYEEQGEGS